MLNTKEHCSTEYFETKYICLKCKFHLKFWDFETHSGVAAAAAVQILGRRVSLMSKTDCWGSHQRRAGHHCTRGHQGASEGILQISKGVWLELIMVSRSFKVLNVGSQFDNLAKSEIVSKLWLFQIFFKNFKLLKFGGGGLKEVKILTPWRNLEKLPLISLII